ncbi:hypothetical protein [Sphingobacterium suaedae]|uniref:DUF4468 domain-containing protein n=1 Tax=Sphingobacterium suaedae TaxID=1686402 RepID=A0ABW5KLI4_9SPHI
MILRKIITLGLFLCSSISMFAQDSFENSLLYNRKKKLYPLYNELMKSASSIKVIDESGKLVVKSPRKNLKGEATFVYEVEDDGSLINVYMTEFWCYSTVNSETIVKDYIIFVDDKDVGFDQKKMQQYEFGPNAEELINFLFDYVKTYRKFKVIQPRERNLKYQRVRFE